MHTVALLSGRSASSILLILAACAPAAVSAQDANAPDDAHVFSIIRHIQIEYAAVELENFGEAKRTGRDIVARALEPLDLGQLTPQHIMLLEPFIDTPVLRQLHPDQRAGLLASLERAAAQPDAPGAVAISMMASFEWGTSGAALTRRLLDHPGLEQAMQGWPARRIFNTFGSLDAPDFLAMLPDIERAIMFMPPHTQTQPLVRPALMRFFDRLDDPSIADQTREARDRMHRHLLSLARAKLSRFAPMVTNYSMERYWIDTAIDVVEYLEGPAAAGSIIGSPAPELDFLWWRGPEGEIQRLSDLRGKVVLLDFWATWCMPCIALFPTLRELQARYAEHDLVIIGVTAIQGVHVPRGEPVIRLRDEVENPVERELELMDRYMERNDVTWNIAFSTRPVTDPRFVVWGIPHVTIIDAVGVIRHSDVAGKNMVELAPLIDSLLEEASLTRPHEAAHQP